MSLSLIKRWAAWALIALSSATFANSSELKMVGYQASWTSIDSIDYDNLTHIIYSFALPRTSGRISALSAASDQKLKTLVQRAKTNNVKVLLAIGGWNGGDDSAWETFSQTTTGVNNFVEDSLYLINKYDLDGIDLDWEYPNAQWKWNNVVRAMGPALKARGKLLTAAVAAYGGSADTIGDIHQLDFVNVMMYECHCGPEEAPWWQMEQSMDYWLGRGLDKERLMLGIPFYGGGGQDVAFHKRKAAHARDYAGGIMIWEIGMDNTGMVAQIANTLYSGGNTGGNQQCDAWVEGQYYNAGDIVSYQGGYYKATNANPGYIPTVSTWFWSSEPASSCETSTNKPTPWVEGRDYRVGDQVIFEGGVYTAINTNPGYIPNVSTWFWQFEYTINQCPEWSQTHNYSIGDKVTFHGEYFEAVAALLPNASNWYWTTADNCL